jgi:serine/threonine protein kinase
MEAIPFTLASFTKDSLASARPTLSTSTMMDPIIGSPEWSHLAESLISGLAYLHEHRIVHGDIKPRNILLRPRHVDDPFESMDASNRAAYDAVYCDFSSSHCEQTTGSTPEVSAVTTSFTSPELLKAFYSPVGGSVSPVATRASDIYALGVTLITAAIGGDMYGGPRLMEMQRLAFARDGRPIEFARNGDQASRIMKKSFVSGVVEGAVKKEASARWTASQWLQTYSRLT